MFVEQWTQKSVNAVSTTNKRCKTMSGAASGSEQKLRFVSESLSVCPPPTFLLTCAHFAL